jgi:hypothetical protein
VNSHHDLESVSRDTVDWRMMSYLTTGSDLGKCAAVHSHDLGGTSSDVVGASTKGLTACSCGVATEASRVLLEGVAASSIMVGTTPMAEPWPPASPVAPMMAPWPATREEEAKRLKATTEEVE